MAMYLGSNKVEIGQGVNDGGGSGDFSMAEVTFYNSHAQGNPYQVTVVTAFENGMMLNPISVLYNNPQTVNLPLYKGAYILFPEDFIDIDEETMPSSTGDIAFDFDEGYFLIAGNGTITMAAIP